MGIKKILKIAILVCAVIAAIMTFLPQITVLFPASGKTMSYGLQALFGGDAKLPNGLTTTLNGAVIGFVGYCLIFVGGLVVAATASSNSEGRTALNAFLTVLAIIMFIIGIIFLFTFVASSTGAEGWTEAQEAKLGAGPIVGGIFGSIAIVLSGVTLFMDLSNN